MRLGTKRMHAPVWWRSKNKSVSGPLVLILIVVLLCAVCVFIMSQMHPVMESLAESQSEHLATMAVNDTIAEALADERITYEDLVTLRTGEDGKVNAIQSNVVKINQLKSDIAVRVQERITGLDTTSIAVPFGSILGSELFAGAGPKIPVKLVPVGSVRVELHNAFSSAGINQTKHDISMDVTVSMGMLMPTVKKNISITAQVPIAETVIVGNVPDSFVNVGQTDQQTENRVLQLAPEGTGGQK